MKNVIKVGDKYRMLTVVRLVGVVKRRNMWECRCDCGKLCVKPAYQLTGKRRPAQSCGCMKGAVKHRLSRHPIYTCWQHMKYRCLVPSNSAYEYYGGRGITVCERWLHFPNFYEDMYPTWVKGLSIERVDNSKGYSPDNCVWASQKQQMRNTRRNRYVDTPDGQMCLRDAETAYGIMEDTLRVRIDAGVSAEMLLTKGKVYHGRTRKKG